MQFFESFPHLFQISISHWSVGNVTYAISWEHNQFYLYKILLVG